MWRKAAVTLTYVALGLAHGIEGVGAVIASPTTTRYKVNFQAAKIAFYSLWAFTRPATSPYYSRFDYHHLSYGLAFLLGSGNAERFGKWIVFDSCVDYNQLGIFNPSHHFVETSPGVFELVPGMTDGVLQPVGMQDGLQVFPADNCFASHMSEFLKEIFVPCVDPTMLDKATARTNYLIENLVIPYVQHLSPDAPQLKIKIDFNLFKTTRLDGR